MKKIFLILTLTIFSSQIYSQPGWNLKHPGPTFSGVISVHRNFAVDTSGRIFKSPDGKNWALSHAGNGIKLNKVFFLPNNVGWAAGNSGTLFKTVDGGANWIQQSFPSAYNISGIYFINTDIGYALGYTFFSTTILKTTNGGSSWSPVNSISNFLPLDIYFSDESTGWICGMYGKVYHTTNSGIDWTLRVTNNVSDLYSIRFVSSTTGWAVGHNAILFTSDAGITWENQNTDFNREFRGAYFLNASTGFVVGKNGLILKTTDGGSQWQLFSPINHFPFWFLEFNSVYFEDNNRGCAVGEKGAFYFTEDGGESWTSNSPLNGITSLHYSPNYVWATATNKLLRSTNDGETWSVMFEDPVRRIYDVHFTPQGNGWIVGEGGSIYFSDSMGVNWTPQNSGITTSLYSVSTSTSENPLEPPTWAYAVGTFGTILNTMNNGNIWVKQTSGVSSHLSAVHFLDSKRGWAAGNSGVILKTTNGIDWTVKQTGITNSLKGIYFAEDGLNGWAVGSEVIIKSTDGGESWFTVYHQPGVLFYNVHFSGIQQGWVTCGLNGILYTANGGSDWSYQQLPYYIAVTALAFRQQTGFSAGEYGAIFKTTNGGITGFEENQAITPYNFLLEQNYPNPFNPSTKISFTVPPDEINGAEVRIVIYDLLGNEISELLKKEMYPGKYTVAFNAGNLPSGIYIYRLTAGKYSAAKKCVFIK